MAGKLQQQTRTMMQDRRLCKDGVPVYEGFREIVRNFPGALPSAHALHNKKSGVLYGMNYFCLITAAALLFGVGCSTVKPPPTVLKVDLPRFMGDWYVVAGILTSFEKGAHHAIENYRLDDKGRIPTTFTFRKGSIDGPKKTYKSMAFVHDRETFAEWRIQFFWPIKFPYLIIYLDKDYQATAVATDDKKYLWIMSRTPQMAPDTYREIIDLVTAQGFDTNKIVKVPQPE